MSLRVRPPASRTCPLCGSCPGRRRTAVCSGGDPCPTGQTGAVHSGNFGCSLLWGNPATRDGQTHSLQHTERKRFTMRCKECYFLVCKIHIQPNDIQKREVPLELHAKSKQSQEKTSQSSCAAASWSPCGG